MQDINRPKSKSKEVMNKLKIMNCDKSKTNSNPKEVVKKLRIMNFNYNKKKIYQNTNNCLMK